KLSGGVKLALAQYRELAAFAQFASDLDETTRKQLERGQRVTELMKQKQYAPLSIANMSLSVYAAEKGYLDDLALTAILPFRKAQDLMKASRPYARLMRTVIGHIARANTEYKHPFLAERASIKRVGYVVISTDRGLCGGLNSNLFRKILAEIRAHQKNDVEID